MHTTWQQDGFTISTDPARLDLTMIHGFLTTCYWAKGIPLETVERSLEHALNFGLYEGERQVGFARVISDRATFAYVGDVFVLEPWRGHGLSKWLMRVIVGHPELQGLRRWSLLTRDAHALYAQVGFTPLAAPERWMERWTPDVYAR
ncbi:MAG TPA: GNAT family N-acetyltransferase [Candidatus Acidoferrales bacterium]|nr:GNAT family N-acetyltransferase [Candidatus Acidoferrales bacterium]